jgi:hypothetical protein
LSRSFPHPTIAIVVAIRLQSWKLTKNYLTACAHFSVLIFCWSSLTVCHYSLQFDPAPRAGEPLVSRRVPDYFLVSLIFAIQPHDFCVHNARRSCGRGFNQLLMRCSSDCPVTSDFLQLWCHIVPYIQHTHTCTLYHFVEQSKIKIPFTLPHCVRMMFKTLSMVHVLFDYAQFFS